MGSENDYVRLLQEYLNYIGRTYTQIPSVPATGYFGALTYNAVEAFQRLFGLDPNGEVDRRPGMPLSTHTKTFITATS